MLNTVQYAKYVQYNNASIEKKNTDRMEIQYQWLKVHCTLYFDSTDSTA